MAEWSLIVGGTMRLSGGGADSLRRLRDTLGNFLQVRQLSILIGAGASFHLGLPAIRQADLPRLEEMIIEAGEVLTKDERDVLERLLVAKGGDVEAVLASLTSSVSYADAWGLASIAAADAELDVSVIAALRGKLNYAIAAACELPHKIPDGSPWKDRPWHVHQEFFRKILSSRGMELPRVKVFTTNYDLAIEQALDDTGVPCFDGFVGALRRRMRLESYDLDLYYAGDAGERRLRKVPRAIQLYKVHGSLNWVAESASTAGRTIEQTGAVAPKDDLALIYPTPFKESDVLGYPYADLLRVLSTTISGSQAALLVVGYSFADAHINRLIFQALAANPSFQLLVVNPAGVIAPDPSADGSFVPADSRLGRLVSAKEPRILVLTGDDATFELLATEMLPDPESGSDDRSGLEDVEDALLGGATPGDGVT